MEILICALLLYLTKRRRPLLAHGGPPAYAASFLRLAERPPGAHVFFWG